MSKKEWAEASAKAIERAIRDIRRGMKEPDWFWVMQSAKSIFEFAKREHERGE